MPFDAERDKGMFSKSPKPSPRPRRQKASRPSAKYVLGSSMNEELFERSRMQSERELAREKSKNTNKMLLGGGTPGRAVARASPETVE